ncbi:MAG: hypothetical protein IJZ42_13250 [Lachnospiraceae bacterium]|nr:hypothetical protein [Lachnospiraceae bacterium]
MKSIKKIFLIILLVAIIVSAFSITIGAEASSEYVYGPHMNDLERIVYNELKTRIYAVANGELEFTQFSIRVDASQYSCPDNELDKAAKELDFGHILYCLLAECPNELFWLDTKTGYGYSYTVKESTTGERYVIYEVDLPVSADYRSSAPTNDYSVSRDEIARARQALSLAKSFVDKYANQSDFEKLKGYANEIALLNTYNTDALSSKSYGDPWQSVYVFDGNPDTNTVCEGYAKAFKYLCDLSTFDKQIYCFIVSGSNHMWNVVQINGENYYVDVTMADQPYGFNYDYILAGGTSFNNGRTFQISKTSGGTISTSYYRNQENIHCEGYLILSETYYHEHSYSASCNDTHHWLECSCGDRIDTSPHTTTDSATCTQRTVCDVCNTEYGDYLPHTYAQQAIAPEYLQTEATCTSAAAYYYSCECGAKGTATFSYGTLTDHNYNADGTCVACGDNTSQSVGNGTTDENGNEDILTDAPSNENSSTINNTQSSASLSKLLIELLLTLLKVFFII